ncbi:unnamed protein product [Prorocentrum cordatum]|uniref:FACT complex subunit n=1 Tax=Prorocentrum cordatum TaxID=2364126 RepID=A0ABN9SWU0_9DINO|nr:unnamed protein product [Polarella glacialis]
MAYCSGTVGRVSVKRKSSLGREVLATDRLGESDRGGAAQPQGRLNFKPCHGVRQQGGAGLDPGHGGLEVHRTLQRRQFLPRILLPRPQNTHAHFGFGMFIDHESRQPLSLATFREQFEARPDAVLNSLCQWLQRAKLDDGEFDMESEPTATKHVMRMNGSRYETVCISIKIRRVPSLWLPTSFVALQVTRGTRAELRGFLYHSNSPFSALLDNPRRRCSVAFGPREGAGARLIEAAAALPTRSLGAGGGEPRADGARAGRGRPIVSVPTSPMPRPRFASLRSPPRSPDRLHADVADASSALRFASLPAEEDDSEEFADPADLLAEASTAIHRLQNSWREERREAVGTLWRQLEAEYGVEAGEVPGAFLAGAGGAELASEPSEASAADHEAALREATEEPPGGPILGW